MFSSVQEEMAMDVTAANKIEKKIFFMVLSFKLSWFLFYFQWGKVAYLGSEAKCNWIFEITYVPNYQSITIVKTISDSYNRVNWVGT